MARLNVAAGLILLINLKVKHPTSQICFLEVPCHRPTTDSPNAAREELWQPEASPRDKDGYYKLVLTARGGGFVPGIYRASANANYLLWKIEPSPLCA
ncbi:hypothetical protein HU200_005352 [Digitaria exilis]|uniref:Uncharacterized protein n=1 Tax=Digitaria exilis TaxID=1010633 RepID=A0A835FS92_9POAL|nr:hypothetical protein HU200_005352 [Digitaria exilis]